MPATYANVYYSDRFKFDGRLNEDRARRGSALKRVRVSPVFVRYGYCRGRKSLIAVIKAKIRAEEGCKVSSDNIGIDCCRALEVNST